MVAVNYLWNPINDNIVREFDDSGNTIAEYTTEPDLYGNVVSQHRGGQTNYLHSDGQGNTTELTNDAGNVTDKIRYSAFGEVTVRTGTTEIPFQYVGQKGYYRDSETGSYSVRRRPCIPQLSRWASLDVESQFGNRFAYVDNRPTFSIDPSGKEPLDTTRAGAWCMRCVGHLVIWDHNVPQPKAATDSYIILQHLQYYLEWTSCEEPPGCTDLSKCRPKKTSICRFSIYEYLGRITFKLEEGKIKADKVSQDHWSLRINMGGKQDCEVKGKTLITAKVRAFKYKEEWDPESGKAQDKWRPPSDQLCSIWGDKPFAISTHYTLPKKPDWWHNFAYESEVSMEHLILCCQRNPKSELRTTISHGGRIETSRIPGCREDSNELPKVEVPKRDD